MPLDIIFLSKPKLGHTTILKKMCHKLSMSNDELRTMKQKRAMSIHLDEINIKPINLFSNKCNLFSPSHNKCNKLAFSV